MTSYPRPVRVSLFRQFDRRLDPFRRRGGDGHGRSSGQGFRFFLIPLSGMISNFDFLTTAVTRRAAPPRALPSFVPNGHSAIRLC